MYRFLRPLLFRLDAEAAHALGVRAAALGQQAAPLVRARYGFGHPALEQTVFGLRFPNPVGLAAGFDKDAELVRFWAALGFGFCEVGSVTARPSPGNPRPRAFRLPEDRALVNRMGLNNAGADAVAERLARTEAPLPLGINLAKTHSPEILGDAATEDFVHSFRRLAPLADYVALNVSCPNTAEGKTFEEPAALDALLGAVMRERADVAPAVPVLVKLSPPPSERFDGGPVDELIAIAQRHGVAGFVASNTASDRAGLRTEPAAVEQVGPGGLSGQPLEARATALVRHLYRRTGGALPIVGVGGVDSAEAAYRKVRAGASLVELYTGLVQRINRGLVRLLERDGLGSIGEAVGADA
ncbi:MAG: quinone-dependent dihydroorotate dehydrogenase [Rhodothermales bacterium]|nr:quinone-dependent dihydroorotate dehydrogenase [Rhodothermales bacterium]